MVMNSVFLNVILFLTLSGRQGDQATLSPRFTAEEKIQQIIERLEQEKSKIDCVKEAGECWMLESFAKILRKQRGDGIRYSWMDKMQALGIKQVSFQLEFAWKRDGVDFRFIRVDYLKEYFVYKSFVKDGKLLRRIRKEGLEKELKEAAIVYL